MPKKGSSVYQSYTHTPGEPLPGQLRGLVRDPVVIEPGDGGDIIVRRVPTTVGDKHECSDKRVELWTTDERGYVTEILVIRCGHCRWKYNLHYLRLWRNRHRRRATLPTVYCSSECRSRAQRLPDKGERKSVPSYTHEWGIF